MRTDTELIGRYRGKANPDYPEPPRELSVIEGEIKALEKDIVRLLREATA